MTEGPYWADILTSSRRVLTLLDRNPLGKTKGSFTRSYWHFRTSDFPSAADQMGLGILSKLWSLEGSDYYHHPRILEWVIYSIEALSQMQKEDGSMDEWYVNERGWAGPTGYVLNACLDAYEILGPSLPSAVKTLLEKIIRKGVDHLARSNEGHVLANHLAIAILPLVQAKKLLGLKELTPVIDNLIADLKNVWNAEEGWSLEYDGADPGYQSATLSFLSKALRYEEIPFLREVCLKSLEFISYFAYPSGLFAGAIGSRHTSNFFFAGVEAFRGTPLGARLSLFIEEGMDKKTQVLGSDLDDHYLIYRLYELLDAHSIRSKVALHKNPSKFIWELGESRKTFSKAGLEVGVIGDSYFAISLSRGGVIRVENIPSKEVRHFDTGILVESDGKLFSTLWQGGYEIERGPDEFTVSGNLVNVSPKIFTPFKFIVFRAACLVAGFHHTPALWLKNFIRRLLMVNKNSSKHFFKRRIEIQKDLIKIETTVVPQGRLNNLIIGGEFWTRFVPQSRHFIRTELNYSSYVQETDVGEEKTYSKAIGL